MKSAQLYPDNLSCPVCKMRIEQNAETCQSCGCLLRGICAGCNGPVFIGFNYCPTCGRPLKAINASLTYQELEKINDSNREQLFRYAQDLTTLYAWKRQVAQYLPTGLLDKVFLSDTAVVGERRYLTVLFADVVGFTEMSSTIDAEAVFILMNDCFRLLVEQVYKFGGSIDKFLGDGMMALFGAPISYGNDAERALRAALGMQEAMITFNRKMLPELGVPLALRIGITSGEAIAGMVGVEGQQSYTVMGSTVNLASRLEGASNPGSILVNDTIYEQTRDQFDFRVLKPITVKGVGEPVPVFEVISPLDRARRFAQLSQETLTSFVGRQTEVERLNEGAQQLINGQGQVAFITAQTGMGKTRLMLEWQQQLPEKVQVWVASAQNFSQRSYDLWQLAILQGLSLQNASQQRSLEVLYDFLGSDTWLPVLSLLLFGESTLADGLADLEPEQLKNQTFAAVRQLLRRVTGRGPLVLILDNIQWADELSIELLAELCDLAIDLPLMFCICGSPEADGLGLLTVKAQTLRQDQVIALPLSALSPLESETLLRQKLPIVQMPRQFIDYVLKRTQGNPYFLEEMISFIINKRFVQPEADGWQIANLEGLLYTSLPGSLRNLIQARIDLLHKDEQQILAYASLLGSTFSASLFLAILEHIPHLDHQTKHLAALVDKLILAYDGQNYHFVHNTIQETVFQTLLSERRQQMHDHIGQAIERVQPDRSSANVELLAYHFAQARNSAKAIPYLLEAGRIAQRQFSNQNALRFLSNVLELLPDAPDLAQLEPHIHKDLADLYQHIGESDRALAHYEQALTQVADANDKVDYIRQIGRVWRLKGDQARAWRWFEQALEEIGRHPNDITNIVKGRLYADVSLYYMQTGNYQQAERWGLDAVGALEQIEALSDLAKSLNALGGAFYFQNRWRESSQQVARAHEIQQQIGDRMGLASSSSNLGILYTIDGQWDKAIEVFHKAIDTCQEIGALEMTLSNAHNNVAYLYLLRGQLDTAEDHLQASLKIKRANETTLELPSSLNNLGLSRLLGRDFTAAAAFLEESIVLCREIDDQDSLSEAARYMAEVKLAVGEFDQARQLGQQALRLAKQTASKANEGTALRTLAKLYLLQADLKMAREAAQASLKLLQEINHIYEIAQTQVMLAEIALLEKNEEAYNLTVKDALPVLTGLKATPSLEVLVQLQESWRQLPN